jgi:hypothetical protein
VRYAYTNVIALAQLRATAATLDGQRRQSNTEAGEQLFEWSDDGLLTVFGRDFE